MHWRTEPGRDCAVLVLGGWMIARLEAHDRKWVVEGGDGRRKEGTASSRGDAKIEALRAVQAALKAGAVQVEGLLLSSGA